jgi:acetoacetyl-CoA synthetase
VRIGTAELYRTVEKLPGVTDSLVVCIELPAGKFFMPMFLQLAPGTEFNQDLIDNISAQLRENCSPRHIPDKYHVVPEIPYTLTGKKLEVPVRKLLLGWPLDRVASRDSMKNPAAIDFFLDYVAITDDYSVPDFSG